MALKNVKPRGKSGSDLNPRLFAISSFQQGKSTKEIATILRVDRSSITNWLKTAGLTLQSRVHGENVRALVLSDYQHNKLSSLQLEKKFGITKATILRWLREGGIPARSNSEAADTEGNWKALEAFYRTYNRRPLLRKTGEKRLRHFETSRHTYDPKRLQNLLRRYKIETRAEYKARMLGDLECFYATKQRFVLRKEGPLYVFEQTLVCGKDPKVLDLRRKYNLGT